MSGSQNEALLPLPQDDDSLITRKALPRYLPLSAQTFAKLASQGNGPPFIKVGERMVAYRVGDLRAWLKRCSGK